MALGGVEGNAGRAAGALVALVVLRDGRCGFRHHDLRWQRKESTPAVAGSFPGTAACIVAGRKNRFSAGTAATTGDPLESNRRGDPAGTAVERTGLRADKRQGAECGPAAARDILRCR